MIGALIVCGQETSPRRASSLMLMLLVPVAQITRQVGAIAQQGSAVGVTDLETCSVQRQTRGMPLLAGAIGWISQNREPFLEQVQTDLMGTPRLEPRGQMAEALVLHDPGEVRNRGAPMERVTGRELGRGMPGSEHVVLPRECMPAKSVAKLAVCPTGFCVNHDPAGLEIESVHHVYGLGRLRSPRQEALQVVPIALGGGGGEEPRWFVDQDEVSIFEEHLKGRKRCLVLQASGAPNCLPGPVESPPEVYLDPLPRGHAAARHLHSLSIHEHCPQVEGDSGLLP